MRIGVISDLHYDLNENYGETDFYYTLHEIVTEQQIDLLVIGGDISNSYETSTRFVEILQTVIDRPVKFIPGNHDYWEKDSDVKDSTAVYRRYTNHPQCLMERPLILNDHYALVGHSAWYNHSVHDPRFSEEELELGVYGERTWQDKLNTNWGMTDRELSRKFAEIVRKDLEAVGEREVILVTHMVTVPEFTVKMPHPQFDYFNAFIATDDFDSLHQEFPIKHSCMGHVHYRHSFERDDISYSCNCLGYEREWRSEDFKKELEASLYTVDI